MDFMKDMRSVLNEILGDDLSPGENLRALRVKKRISQEQLEEITGVARTNISALENNRLEMTSYYDILFGAALGIHPSDILFPNGKFNIMDNHQPIGLHLHVNNGDQIKVEAHSLEDAQTVFKDMVKMHFDFDLEV